MFCTSNFADQAQFFFTICIEKNTMYPKVKVKEQEEDDLLTINTKPPLENVDFLLTYDFNSPASEYDDDSPTSVVRIPESYVSSLDHLSQGEAKNKSKKNPIETNVTPNIRASPVPPPRAVLSSPDNDVLLMRSKVKGKAEPPSASKDHNLRENRHIRCKAIPRKSSSESTKNTIRAPKETREIKSEFKEKTRAGLADKSQRAHGRKPKPDWV